MSFTVKLAQRLARLMVPGVALLVACHLADRPLTGPPPPDQPVQLVVSPASVALDPYQMQQFRAYGRSAAGDSVPVSVSYTATGGAITVSGLYTAGLVPGNFRVIAMQSGGLLADTAAVTVIQVPVAPAAVSPAGASVQVGPMAPFSATLQDANGNTLTGRTVTWSSSNAALATVNRSGPCTGVAAGSATITATSEGESGQAAGTVKAHNTGAAQIW